MNVDVHLLAEELRQTALNESAVTRAWLVGSFANPRKDIDREDESDVDVYVTRPWGDPELGLDTEPGIERVEVVDVAGRSYGERDLHLLYNALMPRTAPSMEYARRIPFGEEE